MCGLVGCAGKIHAQHENALKQLLIVDSLRGVHSTGLASVSFNWDVSVSKEAVLPHYLIGMDDFKAAMLRMNKVHLGHNRAATQGAINRENAHPYEFQNIVGAHNGTLISIDKLPVKDKHEVDSQYLLSSIDQFGSEFVADKIHGAFALTWYDKRTKSLHFWRNIQRPLWFTYLEGKETMFWASEKEMLEFVLARCNLKHEGMIEVPVNKEYIFSIDGHAKLSDGLSIQDRAFYTPPVYNNSYYPSKWENWNNGWSQRSGVSSTKKHLALVEGSKVEGNCNREATLRSRLKRLSDLLLEAL